MLSDLLLPFQLAFMQQAFIITLAVGLPMALLSCYLVLQGWSLLGDAMAHAVFPGIVIAYVVNIPLTIGAFIAGMACALSAGWLDANSRVKPDTVLGIVFASMFALGLVLYVSIETDIHLDHILYGNMLGVTWSEIAAASCVAAATMAFVLLKRRDLVATAFDKQHARAIGIPVGTLHYALLAAVALAVVSALQAVGIILAIAFLVTPGATAFLLVRQFGAMLATACVVTSLSAIIGIYLSFWIDAAPAPTVVMVMTALFIAALVSRITSSRRFA